MNKEQKKITIKVPPLNRLINDKFIPLWNNKDRYLVLYGSRGSSKSDFVAKNIIFRMLTHKFFRCVCIRKTEKTIRGSVLKNMEDNIIKMGLSKYFTINVSPMQVECNLNGNQLLFRGMDEPTKIKSITQITSLWWEEEIDYSESDYTTVATSMRAPNADFIQEIFTINPTMPDYKNQWFWKKFFKDEDELSFRKKFEVEYKGKILTQYATIMQSTWRDNKWLTPIYIQDMEMKKFGDPYIYQTQSLGLWTQEIAVGRFYKDFSITNNSIDRKYYDPERPIHCSWDHNNNPYSACTIYQVYDKDVYQVKEICLKDPRNKLTEVIKEFINIFKDHKESIYIYGDPNGYREDTHIEKGFNKYKMIFSGLKDFKVIDRTTRSAPSVKARQAWINDIFAYNNGGIKVIISMECRNSINDFTMLKEDPAKGGKLKQTGTDSETGIKGVELYGHCFIGKTMINTINGDKRIDEIKPGDKVMTRQGYKSVINVFDNGIKEVKTYKIGNNIITCTPDHKIWTKENNWEEIQSIISDRKTFIIFDKKNKKWKEKQLYSTELNSIDTQMLQLNHQEIIIKEKLMVKILDYIDIFGLKKMVKFLKDFIFTTKMKTRSIMKYQICNLYHQKNIIDITIKNQLKNIKIISLIYSLLKEMQHPKNGIKAMKVKNGINKMPLNVRKQLLDNLFALNVENNLMYQNQDLAKNIVQQNVNVEKFIKTVKLERVYDIEVEECHEYFANNLLVHNCSDTFDYFICEMFKTEFNNHKNGGISNKIIQGPKPVSKNSW